MRNVAELRQAIAEEMDRPFYTRGHNPTVNVLRRKLAALEGAEDALLFASGSAAMAAAVLAFVGAGDHVLCVEKPYGWTRALVRETLPRFGVDAEFIDLRDASRLEPALRPETRMIVLESPNSWTFEQQDLGAIATLARRRGILTVCDNSYATPLLQRPLAHGIDLVVHTLTKYPGGHSDVLAGAVCGRRELMRRIFRGPYMTFGAVLSPHDAYLVLRGLRTLPLRLERSAASAGRVAEFLRGHPRVRRVWRAGEGEEQGPPGQLAGGNGLVTLALAGGVEAAERFCNALKRFLLTCSWGGHESLAWPLCALYPRGYRGPLPPGLSLDMVRLSIGLEPPELLIADLEQALARV
ncbi:MAG: aminotransferase class I/II-fold pyridoxal phosphate-dependent enzyme [Xanthomonadales bacterium]|nr:aminotransferase class I/II-fold pyridoxal phosphate-dependent enzyme [Xanthomonadales bacterium]